jgi:hypothetical protein
MATNPFAQLKQKLAPPAVNPPAYNFQPNLLPNINFQAIAPPPSNLNQPPNWQIVGLPSPNSIYQSLPPPQLPQPLPLSRFRAEYAPLVAEVTALCDQRPLDARSIELLQNDLVEVKNIMVQCARMLYARLNLSMDTLDYLS